LRSGTTNVQALTKDVKKENLERAKNAAVCQVLVNLESRAVVSEDIGRQVLTYGHRYIYPPPPPRRVVTPCSPHGCHGWNGGADWCHIFKA